MPRDAALQSFWGHIFRRRQRELLARPVREEGAAEVAESQVASELLSLLDIQQEIVGLEVRMHDGMLREGVNRHQDLPQQPLEHALVALHGLVEGQVVHAVDALARLEGASRAELAFDVEERLRQDRTSVFHHQEDVALRLGDVQQLGDVPDAREGSGGQPRNATLTKEHLSNPDFFVRGPQVGVLLLTSAFRDLLHGHGPSEPR
mmetsp:Transcript_170921/g.547792  ORF Transcript_170921/g.547792 Transcript_170921/m.547792 type:complete len:205 (-) Transcript_170921:463-1077(-)